MQEAYRLGGWGMYPTTIVGFVLLYCALQYARDPDRRRMHVVRCLSLVTLLTSCLGFTAGTIKSFLSAGDAPDIGNVVVVGVGESLTNIGLGLGMLVLAWIFTSVGAARITPGATREDLTDPHVP